MSTRTLRHTFFALATLFASSSAADCTHPSFVLASGVRGVPYVAVGIASRTLCVGALAIADPSGVHVLPLQPCADQPLPLPVPA